jgi:hypothetical protein
MTGNPTPDVVTDPTPNDFEVAKLLMQEYVSARQEVILHVQLYKTQERNGTVLVALAGLLGTLLIGRGLFIAETAVTIEKTPWAVLGILFVVSTVAFIMLFSALAVLFALQVLAERCVSLEKAMNSRIKGSYFIWEQFAHDVWSKHGALRSRPDGVAGILFYLLVLFLAIVLPLIVLKQISCDKVDWWLAIAVGSYVFYVLATFSLAIYVNNHTMEQLRDDCRQLLENMGAGKSSPQSLTWKSVPWTIATVAATFAIPSVIIAIVFKSFVCT